MTDKISKADQIRALREANAASARKSSRGGGEGTARTTVRSSQPRLGKAKGKDQRVAMPPSAVAGIKPGPRETKPKAAPAMAAPAKRKGRPLDKERHLTLAATKPWQAEGISERTWYRRQAGEGRK